MNLVSKDEARTQGLSQYFTGKPCKRGHISVRWTGNSECRECALAAQRESGNRRIARRLHYHENKKLLSERAHNRNESRRDENKLRTAMWRKNNPHKLAVQNRTRRGSLLKAIPPWFEEEKVKILYEKRDELNEQWGTSFEVDHVIPLNPNDKSVCGLHCWSNLQLLDKSINSAKRDNYHSDW